MPQTHFCEQQSQLLRALSIIWHDCKKHISWWLWKETEIFSKGKSIPETKWCYLYMIRHIMPHFNFNSCKFWIPVSPCVLLHCARATAQQRKLTLLFRGPKRDDLASGARYDNQSPVATCMMKQTVSPYLISGTPIPSMSRLAPRSLFSCCVDVWEMDNHIDKKEQSEDQDRQVLKYHKWGIIMVHQWCGHICSCSHPC